MIWIRFSGFVGGSASRVEPAPVPRVLGRVWINGLGFASVLKLQCLVTLEAGSLPVWSVYNGDLFVGPSLEILTSQRLRLLCSVGVFFCQQSAMAASRSKVHQPTAQQNRGSSRNNWGPLILLHWTQLPRIASNKRDP